MSSTRGRRPGRRTALAAGALVLGTLAACTAHGSAPQGKEPSGDGAEAAPRGHKFTLLATGDIIPYPSIMRQAQRDAGGSGYDFRRILSGVQPAVSAADVALCHLETPTGRTSGPFTGYPLFRSPPQVATALRATGYDSCSTASNHTLDAGPEGVRRTLDALDEAGVAHAGSARSAAERAEPVLLKAGGATLAHLSYTYGTNGIPLPEDRPYLVNLIDKERIITDARRARRAGADVVVASMHWGTEWQQAPDRRQLSLARELTSSRSNGRRDIDLVIGTHNHVPQAYEKVNGTWVVYGLGDQVASFVPAKYRGNEGSMARFTFTPPRRPDGAWTVSEARYLVGHSDTGPPFRVQRATPERFSGVYARVREAVLSRGAAGDGLREAGREAG